MAWQRRRILQTSILGAMGLAVSKTAAAQAGAQPAAAQGGQPPLPNSTNAEVLPDAWQSAERIALWPKGVPGRGFVPNPRDGWWQPAFLNAVAEPELRLFRPERPNGRALLVFPGGGYMFLSIGNEGVDIAKVFTARGYTVFVCAYRLPSEGWEDRANVPLQDAQRAMRTVRSMALSLGFSPNAVSIMGFSAGGHLAASLLTGYDERLLSSTDAVDRLSARPHAAMLIYPVIMMNGPYAHAGSAAALLGNNPDEELIFRRSPTEHVTPSCPPAFLVHALDDTTVPFQNTVHMCEALSNAGKPSETHLFAQGNHGFGLGSANATNGQWSTLAMQWEEQGEQLPL